MKGDETVDDDKAQTKWKSISMLKSIQQVVTAMPLSDTSSINDWSGFWVLVNSRAMMFVDL